MFDGELDGFFGSALKMVHGPIFNEAANGAGTEESRGLNGDSHALGDFGDGANVGFYGAGGSVRANLHAIGGDFAGQGFGVGDGARASAGEADIQRVDAEGFHQVQDFDFFFDAGIVDGRILQAVAKSFVIQENTRAWWD